ncbi:MAG: hypothetical protein KC503_31135 [Myxococcales bacterium]|nr:hypothetical protein [Myxococcales bacterium]
MSSRRAIAGVIVNSNARRVQRDRKLVARLAAIGDDVEVRITDSAAAVEDELRRFRERDVAVIGACGGDGATSAVLSAMMRVYAGADADELPALAVLPAGTMNTVSRNLGVRGAPARILGEVIKARRLGHKEARVRPSTVVLHADALEQPRHGFMFGMVMAARFLEAYYQREPGVQTAVRLAFEVPASALAGSELAQRMFAPAALRIRADGEPLEAPAGYSLVVGSTVRDIGLGLKVTYRGDERPDRLHLVASGVSAAELTKSYHRGFLARALSTAPEHHDRLVERVEIEVEGEHDEPYMLDGELGRARALELCIGPRVEVCRP